MAATAERELSQLVASHTYFAVSATFHYLGPAFAVLLFARVDALGVAWLRIAAAAAVFALWRRPWRIWRCLDNATRRLLPAWGAVLAAMLPAFTEPAVLAAAIGVGVCSSVIPYVCDQLVMARLTRATYALMVSLFPAIATVIGVAVLTQVPTLVETGGVVLVIAAIAVHKQ